MNTRFIPIEKWNDAGHLWPSDESSMRHLLRNRQANGLNACVCKVGRTLLIDEGAFLQWIASHRETAAR